MERWGDDLTFRVEHTKDVADVFISLSGTELGLVLQSLRIICLSLVPLPCLIAHIVLRSPEVTCYAGQWENDLQHGFGVESWEDRQMIGLVGLPRCRR